MRTLVVSDLHLGSRLGRDVLRRPEALAALLTAVEGADRLVLLGDVVELLEGRPRRALAAARPVLRAIGAAMAEREVLVVPGNHDAALIRPWVLAHRDELTTDTPVPLDATPMLAELVAALAPARVRVHHPGVWLAPRVWATHGHYLDRHLLPEAAYGMRLLGRLPRDGARPGDYDSAGPSVTRLEARMARFLPRPLARLVESGAETLRAGTMPAVQRRVLRHRTAPLTSRLLSVQMRRAAIPALALVARRLGVDADWVIFGHVHRGGPLPGDDLSQWGGPPGPRIVNTGSWVYEPRLVHRATPPHPYWPGGAVIVDGDGPPQVLGLLDGLSSEQLYGSSQATGVVVPDSQSPRSIP